MKQILNIVSVSTR